MNIKHYKFFKKMILIGLLYTYFIDSISKLPYHSLIHVYKHNSLRIKEILLRQNVFNAVNLTIPSAIDLSNLVELCKL